MEVNNKKLNKVIVASKKAVGMNYKLLKMGDVFSQIKNGASIKQKDDLSGIPITRIETISNSNLDLNKLGYANVFDDSYKDFYLENGDILMSHINSWSHLGKNAIIENIDRKIIHGMNLLLLKGKKELIFPKYCKYYFDSDLFRNQLNRISNQSVNQSSFSVTKLRELEIPLPPLETQKRIAEILDAADALRRKDQELLKKYDELAQAIFIDMFGDPVKNEKGWEVKKLKEITKKIGSGATPTGGKTSYKSDGISLIRSMNVYDFSFKLKDLAYIDETQAAKLNNVSVEPKDVLFNITGASVCRCSIVPNDLLPARVNQHVAIIRAKTECLNPIFLNHLLVSNSVKSKLLGVGAGGGAVMEAITKDQLDQFEIVVPPIELQNKFELLIQNVFSQKNNVIDIIDDSNSLFNPLIQKAFKGELVA
jgi:type I restriction enzyme S subunit